MVAYGYRFNVVTRMGSIYSVRYICVWHIEFTEELLFVLDEEKEKIFQKVYDALLVQNH